VDCEKYFQPIDEEVPAFAREDAEGNAVALHDLQASFESRPLN
jgi:hypothetical protein